MIFLKKSDFFRTLIQSILESITSKNLPATLLFIDFSKVVDSINREKMKDILLIYSIPTEIVNCIMIFYKITHSTIRSPDGDTPPFVAITIRVLQGDTIASIHYISQLCIENIIEYQHTSWFHSLKEQ